MLTMSAALSPLIAFAIHALILAGLNHNGFLSISIMKPALVSGSIGDEAPASDTPIDSGASTDEGGGVEDDQSDHEEDLGSPAEHAGGWGSDGSGGGGWGSDGERVWGPATDSEARAFTDDQQTDDKVQPSQELVPAVVWYEETSPYTSHPISRLPSTILSCIFIWLLPVLCWYQDSPNGRGIWYFNYGSPLYLYDALFVCRHWYFAAFKCPDLWGALLESAQSQRWWDWIRRMAQSSKQLRIRYRPGLPSKKLDTCTTDAYSIYVGSDSPWQHWGNILQGLDSSHLEVLHLRPRTDNISSDLIGDVLPMPDLPITAPNLREAVLSSPAILATPNLYRLHMSNFSGTQTQATFRSQRSLRQLEIHSPCTPQGERICWTDTLRALGSTTELRQLKIWTHASQDQRITHRTEPVYTPMLRHINVCSAVLVVSQVADFVEVQKAPSADLLAMLSGLRSVTSLTIRNLYDYLDGPAPTSLVKLHMLDELLTYGDLHVGWERLFDGLRAPFVRRVTMSFNTFAPPNFKVLALLRDDIEQALGSDDVAILAAVLNDAWWALYRSGHGSLAQFLNPFPGGAPAPLNAEYSEPGPDVPLFELKERARAMIAGLSDAGAQPPPLHCGHQLHSMLRAMLSSLHVSTKDLVGALIVVGEFSWQSFEVQLQHTSGVPARTLRFQTSGPRWDNSTTYDPHGWPDSAAHCASRMLFGLHILPLRSLRIVDRGNDPFSALHEFGEDVIDVASSLALYADIEVIEVELHQRNAEADVLRALVQPTALPNLKRLVVRSNLPPAVQNPFFPLSLPHPGLWRTLLAVLKARRLHSVVLEGSFCACRNWLSDARVLVDEMHVAVACSARVEAQCDHCKWCT
ncbi:hypothetical protein PENSPDRAFT_670254 [Peniophora sp. CONT]|nr:hypothetical protein PENSPDRAFT_670254 [Peniophora sp. CONT]